ncbi:MAG: hypothetical protein KKA84_01925 [Bacteroidetes bacterium]|nr:hypothetical protein [Bacteroidota bacterium]
MKTILFYSIIYSAALLLIISCDKGTEPSPQASIPILTTLQATSISYSAATSGGNITSVGGAAVTARGVCWSTNSNPTINDNITSDGTGTGSFTSIIIGLSSNTTYYVRAYATNSAGTGYGNVITFSTLSTSNPLEYFGQTPPGMEFVRFAPGIVPEDMYHSVTVSPDGQEIYWSTRNRIMMTKLINGAWTTPEGLPFSGDGTGELYDDAPVVSPDNRKLFFTSLRPYNSSPARARFSFWYSERTETGWSEPQPLPEVINSTGGIHWQVSVSNSGNLYFGIITEIRAQIYFSRLVNGTYTEPEPMSTINNLGSVIAPFISPDESYIIFNSESGGGVNVQTCISFKTSDNQWSTPQRITQFPEHQESAFVTRDGRYVFCKNFWASAEIIEEMRPGN